MTCSAQSRDRAIRSLVARFLADEAGATAVEYGLLVSLISVAIMATIFALGQSIDTVLYERIATALAAM